MVVRLFVDWPGPPHSNRPLHELTLIIVIDSRRGILPFIELHKSKSSNFGRQVVFWYLDGLNLSEGGEISEEVLRGDLFGEVAHVDGSFLVIVAHV